MAQRAAAAWLNKVKRQKKTFETNSKEAKILQWSLFIPSWRVGYDKSPYKDSLKNRFTLNLEPSIRQSKLVDLHVLKDIVNYSNGNI